MFESVCVDTFMCMRMLVCNIPSETMSDDCLIGMKTWLEAGKRMRVVSVFESRETRVAGNKRS